MSNRNPVTQRAIVSGLVCVLLLAVISVAVWFGLYTGDLEAIEARGEARVEEVRGELDRFSAKLDAVVKQLENQPRIMTVDDGPSGSREAKLVSLTDLETLAASRLSRYRAATAASRAAIADAASVAQDWAALEPEVLTGEAGRRIAADVALVRRLRAALHDEVASPADLAAMDEEVAAIEQAVEERLASAPKDAPGEAVIDEIRRIEREARSEQRAIKKRIAVARAAMTASSRRDPSDVTLESVLEVMEAEETAEELERRQQARDNARAEAEKAVEDAIRKLEAAKRQRRIAEIAVETSTTLAKAAELAREAEEKEAAEKAAAEYARRRTEAMRPGNLSRLAPLFAKDYKQPDRYGGPGSETAEKQPMSLMAIRGMGALEATTTGYRALLWVTCGNWTARPRWNMQIKMTHIGQLTSSDREMLRGVQKTLEDYGDVYVKEGMLRP